MAKPPRGSTKPGEMCSYDPKTGLYTDRWLWEEILGEDFSGPPAPLDSKPVIDGWDPSTPPPEYEPDEY
jgi:hypothetical protein